MSLPTRVREFVVKARVKVSVFFLEAVLRPERPATMVRFGSYYGGWWIPAVEPERGVALCVGAGTDVTFDLELQRLGYVVHTADPTPAAVDHVREHAPTLTFHPVGLWTRATTISFAQDEVWDQSWAIDDRPRGHRPGTLVELPVTTVRGLLDLAGADRLAVLKVDIEGAEHDVVEQMVDDGVFPYCLGVEFDDHRLSRVLSTHRRLLRSGYRLLQIEGLNHTYVRA